MKRHGGGAYWALGWKTCKDIDEVTGAFYKRVGNPFGRILDIKRREVNIEVLRIVWVRLTKLRRKDKNIFFSPQRNTTVSQKCRKKVKEFFLDKLLFREKISIVSNYPNHRSEFDLVCVYIKVCHFCNPVFSFAKLQKHLPDRKMIEISFKMLKNQS